MASKVPIPSTAALTVEDLGGASVGGGPWTVTRGKSIALPVQGTKIESGPFLTTNWKEEIVGSLSSPFALTLEPDAGVVTGQFQWNSVDQSQLFWWIRVFNNKSNLRFVYRPDSAAAAADNLQWTIHLRQLNADPGAPGDPDSLLEYTIEMLAAFISITDGTSTLNYGASLV